MTDEPSRERSLTYKVIPLLNQEDALVVILTKSKGSVRARRTSTNNHNILLQDARGGGSGRRQSGGRQEADEGLGQRHDELRIILYNKKRVAGNNWKPK